MPGQGVAPALRRAIYKLAEGRCAACREEVPLEKMDIDHIIPVLQGGPDEVRNLRCLCKICHKLRHGWGGSTETCRYLSCGCWISVLRRRHWQADDPKVLAYLQVERCQIARGYGIVLITCRRHGSLAIAGKRALKRWGRLLQTHTEISQKEWWRRAEAGVGKRQKQRE